MLSKKFHAIVIYYCGAEITDSNIAELAKIVKKSTTKDAPIQIESMDGSDLAKIVVLHNDKSFKIVEDENPVQSACIIIGTTYYDILSKPDLFMQSVIFGYKLSADIKRAIENNNNNSLLKAVKILSEVDPPEDLKSKYKLTPTILTMIKDIASHI